VNDSWAQLCVGGLRRRVAPGEPVFVDGDLPRTLVLVTSGLVKVIAVRRDGRPVTLALRGPGEAHVGPVTRSPTAASHLVAAVRSDIVVVTATRLRELVHRTPGLFLPVLGIAEQRLREAEQHAAEQARLPAADRVRRILATLARRFGPGGDGVVALPISQFDLADLAGVSREAAARALRVLRENGEIQTARFQILIVRPDEIAPG